MGEHDYSAAIAKIKVPMLILDQKWHRLFALGGKPSTVKELETRENDLLKREAELKKELKDLKKVKENLMSSVMTNMEGTSDLVSKKLDDDKRLLEECKERIDSAEDELMDIPNQTDEVNKQLMLASMDYCYDKLRTNSQEAEEITNWIKDIRVQLKKNVIRKHNREINNKEIYSYMHDVFGMEVLKLKEGTRLTRGLASFVVAIVNNNHIDDEDSLYKAILDFRSKQSFYTFEQIDNKNTKTYHDSIRVRFEIEKI